MNEHARQVIDAYLDAEKLSVPHAILVEGPWGSGKTYFLKKVYEPHRERLAAEQAKPHTPFLIVSLFGATSAADVEMRIYKTANPNEAVAASIAGKFVLGVGEFLRVKETAKAVSDAIAEKAISRGLDEYIFVLDDLERVEPKAFGEIMGLVNSFVAEHDRRVILVTDETKLKILHDEAYWKDQNEKVIGRRARIEPDISNVVEMSISELRDGPAKDFMTARTGELVEVAKASKEENLRNLAWAVHNAGGFVESLLSDADIPHDHVARVASIVLATTLWYRSGKLDDAVLQVLPNISSKMVARSLIERRAAAAEPRDPILDKAKDFAEAFPTLQVDAPPVDYSFISNFEKSGVLDNGVLIDWVKSVFGFGRDITEPAWRQLWYSHERPVQEVEQAIETVKVELADRKLSKAAEIMQVTGLAIELALANDRRLTNEEEVVPFFKSYIDDLAGSGELEKKDPDPFSIGMSSYAGVGFRANDSADFGEVKSYLEEKQEAVEEANIRGNVEAIIRAAEGGDLSALFKLIRSDEYKFSRHPVLMGFSADRIATLFTNDTPSLHIGRQILCYRYAHAGRGSPLLREIPWARDVFAAMMEKLDRWDDPHRTLAKKVSTGTIRHYDSERIPEAHIFPVVPAVPEVPADPGPAV